MIQNRHSIHTFITKWKYRWSHEEWPLGYSGNFTFLQVDTWTVLVTSIRLPKPPGSILSRIIRWAKTILGSLCTYFLLSYTASLWCPRSPQTLIYSMPWGLDNIPGHQFPLLPNQNVLMSLRASYHFCRAYYVPNANKCFICVTTFSPHHTSVNIGSVISISSWGNHSSQQLNNLLKARQSGRAGIQTQACLTY